MKRRRIFLLVGVAAAVAALWLNRSPILSAAGEWLDVGGPLQGPVDAVVVLGGGADTRPLAAAAIVQAGFAQDVLLSDPPPDPDVADSNDPTDYELNRGMLLSEGIESNRIQKLAVTVASTRGEATAIGEYLREHPAATLAVVTTNYHTRRARLLIARQAPSPINARVVFVSVPTDGYAAADWWTSAEGLQAYLLEFIKLLKDAAG